MLTWVWVVLSVGVGRAAAVPLHEPDFSLTIAPTTKTVVAKGKDTYLAIDVKIKNISQRPIYVGCYLAPVFCYHITVLENGSPAKRTKLYDWLLSPHRHEYATEGIATLLAPGKTRDGGFTLSSYFELSTPGVYEVYVTRESRPYYPTKSVLVESNAISFEVPASSAAQ